jgi:hypothetical protein
VIPPPASPALSRQQGQHHGDLEQPTLPPDLDGALNGRERRTVWLMLAGLDYHSALDRQGIPKRATLRDHAPPEHVLRAVTYLMAAMAEKCAISRTWILQNTVALYRRASQAEPVLDRRGVPTGVYRFDGATAARCLELLGKASGVFRDKGQGIAASDVADLLAAVAARGKQRPPEPRLVGTGDAAPALAAPRNAIAQGRGPQGGGESST